jgi:hypothetical protein
MIGSSKSTFGFDPRTIPGCQLWLDAADTTTLTLSGSNVTQWSDKSGTGNNYSNSGTITYTNNSVYFNGSSDMKNTSPLNFSIGTNPSMSTFMVFSYVNSASIRGLFQYGLVTCSKTGYVLYIETGKVNATLYCGDLSVNNTVPANVTTIVSDVVTYTGTSGSLTRSGWVNGAPMSVTNVSTTGVNLNLNSISTLGNTAYNQPFLGYISEVIYYNQSLTTSQRQQVEGYLAHKWGLTGYYFPTSPLTIPGLALWLDAADPAGTGTPPSNGTNLTTWKDKSIYNFPITSAGSSYNTTAVNGLPGINISTNPFGYNPGSAQNNWQEVFAVALWTGGSTFNNYNGLITSSVDTFGSDGIIFIGNTNTTNWYPIGNTYTTPIINGTQTYTAIPTIQSPFIVRTFSTTAVNLRGVRIGLDRSFEGRNWQGFISEVIIYNTALTTTQRQTIEAYLAKKWGIGASSIPSTHPFYSVRPYLRAFNPTDISGCRLWLDAADSNTITLSSGSLTQWNDKSGNGRNLTAVSGYANATVSSAFQNGLNVLNFSGNGLYRAAANSAVYPLDAYIIVALKSLTAQSDVLSIGPTDADNFNSLIFSEGTQSRWKNGSSFGVRNVFSTTDETSTGFLLIQWSIANNNYLLRRNGVLLGQSTSFTYTLPAGSIFQVGFRHQNITSANFSGYIGEIVVFNSQLGDSQRQQVEGYLARKWGISISSTLPSLHPFNRIPPATVSETFTNTFTYTGSDQSFVVPTNVTSIKVYIWAAGGQGTTTINGSFYGGAGAYVQGVLAVTPGETLTIYVGQRGTAGPTFAYKNGGYNSAGDLGTGTAGGRSGIARSSTNIVAVGAGGGGGGSGNGGAGGITSGSAGGGTNPGGGGTQSAGGSAGSSSYNSGGVGQNFGGGTGAGAYAGSGGDGFYGGGGGSAFGSGQLGGGGGGGSSLTSNLTSLITSVSSNGYSAPNTKSIYYRSTIASGGYGSSGTAGNGLVVITSSI